VSPETSRLIQEMYLEDITLIQELKTLYRDL
jgi:hypothetical protein